MALAFFGDPCIDVVVNCSESFLSSHGISADQLGGSSLVNQKELDELRDAACAEAGLSHGGARRTGGSAANVAQCVSRLGASNGAPVRFIGMAGADEAGDEFAAALRRHGVEALMARSITGAATATCLCLVTPGGERTFRTCLGAADELQDPSVLPAGWADGCAWLHCEGYVLHRPAVALQVIRTAVAAGARVSLDLASFEVVRCCWPALEQLLDAGLLHTVFCNEEEAAALLAKAKPAAAAAAAVVSTVEVAARTASQSAAAHEATPAVQQQQQRQEAELPKGSGTAEERCSRTPSEEEQDLLADIAALHAQTWLLQRCQVAVVSLGGRGCVGRSADSGCGAATADRVTVVDTVGAGDSFSAGWLTAYLAGAPLDVCAAAGTAAGTAAVQAVGGVPDDEQAATLTSRVNALLHFRADARGS